MFWGERKIGEETYLHVNLLSPNGARAFLNRPQSASRWAETLEFWAEQKNGKDNNFQLVLHWVFSILKYITKVKLLFLYIFYVLYVLFHYKPLSGDGGRVRPHFYVLR